MDVVAMRSIALSANRLWIILWMVESYRGEQHFCIAQSRKVHASIIVSHLTNWRYENRINFIGLALVAFKLADIVAIRSVIESSTSSIPKKCENCQEINCFSIFRSINSVGNHSIWITRLLYSWQWNLIRVDASLVKFAFRHQRDRWKRAALRSSLNSLGFLMN